MRKALLLSILLITSVSLAACGKKEEEAIIIQAQNTDRDTTKSELVKGDSAGTAESDKKSGETTTEEIAKSETASGWHTDLDREIPILGEWECSDGSRWTLDNGYNLTYKDGVQDLIGSYSFTFTKNTLSFSFWNIEKTYEVEDLDDEGNVKGTHEEKTYVSGLKKYEILEFTHNDDYTTASLKLKDESGKELTATMTKPIAVDDSVADFTENKAKFEEESDKAAKEEQKDIESRESVTESMDREAYKEMLEKMRESGMTKQEYLESIGEEENETNGDDESSDGHLNTEYRGE